MELNAKMEERVAMNTKKAYASDLSYYPAMSAYYLYTMCEFFQKVAHEKKA